MPTVTKDLPRRIHMELWTPAERAIHDAVQVVEAMPADVRLTEAVQLLGQAQAKVADFVDGQPTAGPITYAKAGGPPDNWRGLKIYDLDTGKEVWDVEEVSAVEGWLIRMKRNEKGEIFIDPANGDEVAVERLEGRFEIRRPA